MCFASTPQVPPVPEAPPEPPSAVDPGVKTARSKARANARSAAGLGGTIVTGPAGDTSAPNLAGGKTTLGS